MEAKDIKWKVLPKYGKLLTFEEFVDYCYDGFLMDDDGIGYFSNGAFQSDVEVYPSDVNCEDWDNPRPDLFTHVMWFNQ